MGAPDFSKLKTLIHELICVENKFYSETIKMKMEPSQLFVLRHKRNQQPHPKKDYAVQ